MTRTGPPVCDYEGSDYQQTFWEQGGRTYEDRVEAIALERLVPGAGQRLLEVGAGAGRNTQRYQGFKQIVLLDYSRTQLEQARDRLGEGEHYIYVAADVYRMPFRSGVFDGATMIRTLHHLVEPQLALGQIKKSLLPGATLILEFANKRNFKAILRWLLGRQDWSPFSPQQVEFAELNFDFHPRTIRSILRASGFEIRKVLTVSHFRIEALKRWLPLEILVRLDSWLQWTGAWWQLTPSVFLEVVVPGEPTSPGTGSIFACPDCGQEDLEESTRGLRCKNCGCLWAFRQGIYDFKEPLQTR